MIDSRDLSFEILKHVDQVCERFEHKLSVGQQPSIEAIVGEEDNAIVREYLLAQLVAAEIDHTGSGFNHATYSRYQERFSDFEAALESLFRQKEMTILVEDSQKTIVSTQPQDESLRLKQGSKFGKYEVLNFVGEGSFGVVYSARDTDLERDVALKLSRFKLSESSQVQNRFIDEAKSAAKIKGDGVATIFDLFTEDDRVCIVQELVDGSSLSQLLQQEPLPVERSISIAVDIAGSIARAHDQGIYHRDLKPGNIIINRMGNPILVDFGLAVSARELESRMGLCGTPNYMSPEQVRGESNRTNNTTDIWAIGVVLYEMLAGVRPFSGNDNDELFNSIQSDSPASICEVKPDVSKELNRIVFKCIAKRQRDRYSSADLLVKDLKRSLRPGTSEKEPSSPQIVPKGLRSYSEADQEFFLSLLPGPLDHRGVPESVSFWASQINEQEDSFPVGLIYGTSGCGKSSFVKAGLIPQLSENIRTIYIEANQFDTELRVFSKLRDMFSEIPDNMSLPETLAIIRDGSQLREGEKVLVIIDQFEQWLSANNSGQESQLGYALRHCDGKSVQALLLIREDYWPTASRFMEHIEVPVVQDRNCRPVELFDRTHARKLLFQIGRAHQRFQATKPDRKQTEFLNRVVNEISEHDRVVGIRLAMFAEAFKNKDWTLESLSEFGGADAAGVAFLNETFVLPGAPPAYKMHQRAAQSCIQAMLPAQGSNLKGHMKSRSELLDVSGYENEPSRFDELIGILEKDLKLITSTEPVERLCAQTSSTPSEHYFQLSHDYLVPVTRRWIDIEDRRHVQGRVEARMAEVAEVWGDSKHSRYLPTWWESLNILLFSRWQRWSNLQQEMMVASLRKHSVSAVIMFLFLSLLTFAGFRYWQHQKIKTHVASLKSVLLLEIEEEVEKLDGLKKGLIPELQREKGRIGSVTPINDEHRQVLAGEDLKLSIALAILNDSNWEDISEGFEFISTDQVRWLAAFLQSRHSGFDDLFEQTLDLEFDPLDENQFRKSIALAQWGQPKYLAKFLTYRELGNAKTLIPILSSSTDASLAALGEEVKDLRSDVYSEVSSKLVELVESYNGNINIEAGIVFSVPFDSVRSLLQRLFAENYAPTCIRPYYSNETKLVAIAFRRGFRFEHDKFDECILFDTKASPGDIETKHNFLEKKGWRIADISFVSEPTGEKESLYSAVWVRENSRLTKLEMDVSEEYFEQSIEFHSKESFQIERIFACASRLGSPRYSMVWSKSIDGRNESIDFLAKPQIKCAAETCDEVLGASQADAQFLAINVSRKDYFHLFRLLPRFDEFAHPFLAGDKIKDDARKMMNSYGSLLARVGETAEAAHCFSRLISDNPGWVDEFIHYSKFLSGLPDRNAYAHEVLRLEQLNLSPTQSQILIPVSDLRMAVTLGEVDEAKALYEDLLEHFDSLDARYRAKPSALKYIETSRIRATLIYFKVLEASSSEARELLDWCAEHISLIDLPSNELKFLTIDTDFDVLRIHPRFQEFLCRKMLGYRVIDSWRNDPSATTRLSIESSIAKLRSETKMLMSAGYAPKTVSCQQVLGTPFLMGRVVSERKLLDKPKLRENRTRLARSAVLLNALGQSKLKQQIEEGEFGEEVRIALLETIDK